MKSESDKETDNSDFSRRDLLKSAGLAAGITGALAVGGKVIAASGNTFVDDGKKLPLSVTGYDFNRLAALADGTVSVEGCDTQFTVGKIGDMNTDVFSGEQTYDVTEIGLHPFMLAYANDNFRDYTLLPVFPLRLFRHKSIFIRNDRGIKTPEDLKGKTIASPGYSSTSLTWIRGILQDEYDISPQDVQWVTAVKDSSAEFAGKVSKQEGMVPDGVEMVWGTPGKDESELLVSGEVDALFHAGEPRAFTEGNPVVSRLFADSPTAEAAYYAKTGIFPIMHAVAVKTSLLEEHPWLAEAIFNAYSQSKQISYQNMANTGWIMDMLPWYGQELERTRAIMGDNFYSYGMGANRKTLETLFRYSHEQGFSDRQLTVEELFYKGGLTFVE